MNKMLQNQVRSDSIQANGNRRCLETLLAAAEGLADRSVSLVGSRDVIRSGGEVYELPRYTFIGPRGGDEPLRIGIFAGVHGDEPEGIHALVRFLELLENDPEIARGFVVFAYPICNPTGVEDRTRHARSGKDLNREFWRNSSEPEVRLLEEELRTRWFDGIITLHTDDTSDGFYGFAQGATFSRNLIEPALEAASEYLPLNDREIIDGFPACNAVIHTCYEGVLSPPPQARPQPFDIILETPQSGPAYLKEMALLAAMRTILVRYREMMAYAPNL